MYEVFLWVPSRGWKLITRTKNKHTAARTALNFVPLEVKLRLPDGRSLVSGGVAEIMAVPHLSQIEKWADTQD